MVPGLIQPPGKALARPVPLGGRCIPHRTAAMQDAGYGLRRISLLGTSVHKGMKVRARAAKNPGPVATNRYLSACVVYGLYALALVLEAEVLVAAVLALSLARRPQGAGGRPFYLIGTHHVVVLMLEDVAVEDVLLRPPHT